MARREIANLLAAHTTVTSWGVPCTRNLARLMNAPMPRTITEKTLLIRNAQRYVRRKK